MEWVLSLYISIINNTLDVYKRQQLVRKEFLEYHEPDLEERKRHILRVIVEYAPENTYKAAALLTPVSYTHLGYDVVQLMVQLSS